MFVEPRQTPHDTQFIGIGIAGQSCYKPQYLHIANSFICHAGNDLINRINLNRCTEDTYLQVKQWKEDWKIEAYVEDKPAYKYSVMTINSILQVLELKFDEDEEVQKKK